MSPFSNLLDFLREPADHPLRRPVLDPLTEPSLGPVDRVKRPLRVSDFDEAAASLGVDPAALEALSEVESAGSGFGPDGRLLIRFEPHRFRHKTQGRYDSSHEHLSMPYGQAKALRRNQTTEWRWFKEASELDYRAAVASTSWGRFQVMGFNYQEAGFTTIEELPLALAEGEQAHLRALAEFVKADPKLLEALRSRDWAVVASRYNGKDFKAWRYDEKLAAAYQRARRRRPPPLQRQDPPGEGPVLP